MAPYPVEYIHVALFVVAHKLALRMDTIRIA